LWSNLTSHKWSHKSDHKFSRLCIALFLLMFLGSGCVFLRLSRVLVQMKEPERFLEVDQNHTGFKASLLSPIILLTDLEFVFGKKAVWDGEAWKMTFEKMGPQDRQPWGVRFWVNDKKQLMAFQLPQKLSGVLGHEFVMKAIEAIGRGEVSIGKRRVYMDLQARVTEDQVLQLMGAPKSIETAASKKTWLYEFGESKNPFMVSIHVSKSVDLVVMDTNGYGIEVMVKKLETNDDSRK
jgi:hypothetical protein